MDKLLMFSAYMGLAFGSFAALLFLGCCLCKWHDVFTADGRFAVRLLACQNKRVVYPFRKWGQIMVLGLGWYFVWKYG